MQGSSGPCRHQEESCRSHCFVGSVSAGWAGHSHGCAPQLPGQAGLRKLSMYSPAKSLTSLLGQHISLLECVPHLCSEQAVTVRLLKTGNPGKYCRREDFFLVSEIPLSRGSCFVQVLGWRVLLWGDQMAASECTGEKQEDLLVLLRLGDTGGICAGPATAELSPAKPLGPFVQICVQHGALCPPHTLTPGPDWACGVSLLGSGDGRDELRPSTRHDNACGDGDHHEPAWGGCLAVGTPHCSAAPRGLEGVAMSHLDGQL